MNIAAQIKSRITVLNVLRLIVGVACTGQALHSFGAESIVFFAMAAMFFLQVYLNKKCGGDNCPN